MRDRPGASRSLGASGLPQFRSPRVGVRRGGCAFVAAPTARQFQVSQQFDRQISNAAESHSVKILSSASVFDDATQTREARNAVPENPTFGSRHDR
jgi:hypothetical protein